MRRVDESKAALRVAINTYGFDVLVAGVVYRLLHPWKTVSCLTALYRHCITEWARMWQKGRWLYVTCNSELASDVPTLTPSCVTRQNLGSRVRR